MLTFQKTQLRAAMQCAATKDIRSYIVGVHVECTQSGDMHIVATDGHQILVGKIPAPNIIWTGDPQKGPWRMTIPLDALKRETKGSGTVDLTALPDGRYQLGSTVFAPVDGTFPDWRRVCQFTAPTAPVVNQIDPRLLMSAQSAVMTWHGDKSLTTSTHVEHGDRICRVIGTSDAAFAIIMPLRNERKDFPATMFEPVAYEVAA
jgi:hypothetical protein